MLGTAWRMEAAGREAIKLFNRGGRDLFRDLVLLGKREGGPVSSVKLTCPRLRSLAPDT